MDKDNEKAERERWGYMCGLAGKGSTGLLSKPTGFSVTEEENGRRPHNEAGERSRKATLNIDLEAC